MELMCVMTTHTTCHSYYIHICLFSYAFISPVIIMYVCTYFKYVFVCSSLGPEPAHILGLGPFWGKGPGVCELNQTGTIHIAHTMSTH